MDQELCCGWLSPQGEFIQCNYFDHDAVASDIAEKHQYYRPGIRNPGDLLVEFGWVRISMSLVGCREWCLQWERFLTDTQKSFMQPYFENDIPVSFGTVCRWEREAYK